MKLATKSLIFLGVDPGCEGAMTVLAANDSGSYVGDLIAFGGATESEIADALRIFADDYEVFAALESVHSMPKQGVASTFKFGKAYGFIRGVLIALGIPFEDVTPQKWQKELGCLTKGDKNVSKAKAQQLFPGVKITNKTGDSVCIAEYAKRLWHQRNAIPAQPRQS